MKKQIISVITAVCMSAVSIFPVFSANAADKNENLLILGDSISTGYNVGAYVAHNYGEIVGDYYGWNVTNKAVNGITSEKLIELIDTKDYQTAVIEADTIVVSIGGNDLIQAAMGVVKEKYPENFNISDPYGSLLAILNQIQTSGNMMNEATALVADMDTALQNEVSGTGGTNTTVPEVSKKLHDLNPDAEIVFQTLYNPCIMSETVLNAYLSKYSSDYKNAYTIIRNMMRKNIRKFNETSIGKIDGIKIADVYDAFSEDNTSTDTSRDKYGYSHIYTNLFTAENRDFHPNQAGHAVIAAEVINAIGKADGVSSGILYDLYSNLSSLLPQEGSDRIKALLSEKQIEYKKGDVTGDKVINAIDAAEVLTYYAYMQTSGSSAYFNDGQKTAADVNDDGVIDAIDASVILSHYASIQTGGPGVIK